jgi:hypothetical protein
MTERGKKQNNMKHSTTLAVLALVTAFLLTPSAQAAPCLAGSGATSLTNQAAQGSCEFNGFFFDFSQAPGVSAFGGAPLTPGVNSGTIAANTNVTLTAISALVNEIRFDAADATTSYSVAPGSIVTFNYFYSITPMVPLALINMDYDVVNARSTTFGGVTGFKLAQELATLNTHQTQVGIGLAQADGNFYLLHNDITFSGFQGQVNIQDSITLIQGVGVSSVGALGNQGSLINTLTYVAVPEPLTMLLSGVGLVGLGLLRRRTKKA